jgi:hypothetical protein
MSFTNTQRILLILSVAAVYASADAAWGPASPPSASAGTQVVTRSHADWPVQLADRGGRGRDEGHSEGDHGERGERMGRKNRGEQDKHVGRDGRDGTVRDGGESGGMQGNGGGRDFGRSTDPSRTNKGKQ